MTKKYVIRNKIRALRGSNLMGRFRIEDGIQGFRGFQTAATFRL